MTRSITRMTISDAEHYTPEQRAAIVASYPLHEREARTLGNPSMGSGAIFAVPDEDIAEPLPTVPAHWAQIGGCDFGWDHPFAAVHIAWDRDADVVHVLKTFRARESTAIMTAAAVRPWGAWLPWAWPHDGLQHDKGSGQQLAAQHAAEGMNMLPERATFEDGSNGVEAGLMDMLGRMQTGRLKVAEHLTEWFEEKRLYHRKNGQVVKKRDDLMSATRYAIMMLRHAETKPMPQVDTYRQAPGAHSWMA